ncbi:MAG: S8 family serine peptidase [Thermoplasmata archaeon]|nr:S8 family serine peptidase [Thermoplasmata archaeon]
MRRTAVVCAILFALIAQCAVQAAAGNGLATGEKSGDLYIIWKNGGTLPSGFEILRDYGGFVTAKLSTLEFNYLRAAGFEITVVEEPTMLSVGRYTFDTSKGEPEIPAALKIPAFDGFYGYYVIQFHGPIPETSVKKILEKGTVYTTLHNNGLLIKYPVTEISLLVQTEKLIFCGNYHPSYKFNNLDDIDAPYGKFAFAVLPGENVVHVIQTLNGYGIYPEIEYSSPVLGTTATFYGDGADLIRIAKLPEVSAVGRSPVYRIQNDIASRFIETFNAWSGERNALGRNLLGTNQIVAIADTGLDTQNNATLHEDFQGRVVAFKNYGSASTDTVGHGTHCAGSILGNGYLSEVYQGFSTLDDNFDNSFAGSAPRAKIYVQNVANTDGSLGGISSWLSSGLNDFYNAGARISSNSWGGTPLFGLDTTSPPIDEFMWTHNDTIFVFAAGNSGPGSSTVASPGLATNPLTVGASENLRPEYGGDSDNPSQIASFSSRGPTSDNRIKPDVVAPGTWILSARSTQMSSDISWGHLPWDADHDGVEDYCFMGGTSMATPLTAGALALIREYYVNKGVTPSGALLKASAINSAVDLGYGYPSNDQGWGRINLRNVLFPQPPATMRYWDNTTGLSQGASSTTTVQIYNSSVPLRVTLVWTDPPAGGFFPLGSKLDNDLNLVVTAPNGTKYYGNKFTNSWSTPNPSTTDNVNTVENVYVKEPATGTWTFEVRAQTISQGPQKFAMVATAALGPSEAVSVGITSSEKWYLILRNGDSTTVNFNVWNMGTAQDTLQISTWAPPGVTVTPSQNSVTVASMNSHLLSANVNVGSTVALGTYEIKFTVTSQTNTSIKSCIIYKLVVSDRVPLAPMCVATENKSQSDLDVLRHNGVTYIVYVSEENGTPEIWLKYSSDCIIWQKEKVSTTAGIVSKPAIAADGGNHLIVAWLNGKDIRVNYKTIGGAWTTDRLVASASDSTQPTVDEPSVFVDKNGYIWVLYKDLRVVNSQYGYWDIKYVRSSNPNNPASFTSAAVLPNLDTNYANYLVDSLTDSHGNSWVAYYSRNPQGTGSALNRTIKYAKYDGSTWTHGSLETNSSGNNYYPGLFEDSYGKVWFAWASDRQQSGIFRIYLKYYDYAGGTWSNTLGPFGNSTSYSPEPSLAEGNGKLWLVFGDLDNPYSALNLRVISTLTNFTTVSTDTYLTADSIPRSVPRALSARENGYMPDIFYSQIYYKGGTWTGIGEYTANNDNDIVMLSLSDAPVTEIQYSPLPYIILLMLGLVLLWRKRS